jgi:hypothetical protein
MREIQREDDRNRELISQGKERKSDSVISDIPSSLHHSLLSCCGHI